MMGRCVSTFVFLSLSLLPIQAYGASIKILTLGDSLTAGHNLAPEDGLANQLQILLRQDPRFKDAEVINASVSGSTSASAHSRLKWILKSPPQVVILELGANDGLRGVDPVEISKNIAMTIETLQKAKIAILLCGMKLPPNYGKDYTKRFEQIFPDLAKKYQVPYLPFLLEGVAGDKALNQADGIHPNAKGEKIMAKNVFDGIVPVLLTVTKK